MNNEPVAYWDGKHFASKDKSSLADIPLYTHPVKELDEQFKKGFEAGKEEGWKAHKFHHPVKELTDEEIYACFHQYFVLGEPKPTHYELEYEDLIEFARAILRKAQDK